MKRANTIRQFISLRKLSIVALSSDYLSALKVREHDAKRGIEGAFAGACTPRYSGKFNNKRRNRQPEGYYTKERDFKFQGRYEKWRTSLRQLFTPKALATLAEPPPTA